MLSGILAPPPKKNTDLTTPLATLTAAARNAPGSKRAHHTKTSRGLAASAGVCLKADEMEISASCGPMRLWVKLYLIGLTLTCA